MKHKINEAPIAHDELVNNYAIINNILHRHTKTHPRQKLGPLGWVMLSGSRLDRPCRSVYLSGRKVLMSHVVWYYVTGDWPHDQLDHIDGDTLNNDIDNLREVTAREHARISRAKRKQD